jgi:hypothetical protein
LVKTNLGKKFGEFSKTDIYRNVQKRIPERKFSQNPRKSKKNQEEPRRAKKNPEPHHNAVKTKHTRNQGHQPKNNIFRKPFRDL